MLRWGVVRGVPVDLAVIPTGKPIFEVKAAGVSQVSVGFADKGADISKETGAINKGRLLGYAGWSLAFALTPRPGSAARDTHVVIEINGSLKAVNYFLTWQLFYYAN